MSFYCYVISGVWNQCLELAAPDRHCPDERWPPRLAVSYHAIGGNREVFTKMRRVRVVSARGHCADTAVNTARADLDGGSLHEQLVRSEKQDAAHGNGEYSDAVPAPP